MMSETASYWQSNWHSRSGDTGWRVRSSLLWSGPTIYVHIYIEYIRSGKCLNPRQARWALFFGWFKFALTYRPCSRNTKPDALSHLFEREEVTAEPDTIIPKTCIIGAATWEVEREVRADLQHHPDPGNGPPGCLFVPPSVRSSVLQWGHSSKLSCHLEVACSLAFLCRRFWWPDMRTDVQTFVLACPVCAQIKGSNRPPTGLLQPLPIPRCPWSHLSLDFVSGLPPSKGMTVVLTVVDRFSKFASYHSALALTRVHLCHLSRSPFLWQRC